MGCDTRFFAKMNQDIHLKYLAKNPQDLLWGLAVNSAWRMVFLPDLEISDFLCIFAM